MTEELAQIAGYEGLYEVSDHGNVWSVPRLDVLGRKQGGAFLTKAYNKDGYPMAALSRYGHVKFCSIHRLVAVAFLRPVPGATIVNHIDGNKNNSHVSNLEWVTHGQNERHATVNGLKARGERNGGCKLTERQVLEIRLMRASGNSIPDIAALFSIGVSTAKKVIYRQTWRHLQPEVAT